MNLMQRLHSILAPYAPPATRAPHPSARVSQPANVAAFAAQLAQASILPTGTEAALDLAAEGAAEPLSAAERRDTLASLLPELPALVVGSGTESPVAAPAITTPGSRTPEPAPLDTPPPASGTLSTAWPSRTLRGSGATGPGINGTDAGARAMVEYKFTQYSDPAGQGLVLNDEGRCFLKAVDAGYVPMTADGLETFLAWQSMGKYNADLTPSGKPEAIHQFFTGWYADPIG